MHMKAYQCHKKVKGAQIVSFNVIDSDGNCEIEHDCAPGVIYDFDKSVYARYEPVVGDYLVEYEGDYFSVSPKKAFENGYTEILPPTSESIELAASKNTLNADGKALLIDTLIHLSVCTACNEQLRAVFMNNEHGELSLTGRDEKSNAIVYAGTCTNKGCKVKGKVVYFQDDIYLTDVDAEVYQGVLVDELPVTSKNG